MVKFMVEFLFIWQSARIWVSTRGYVEEVSRRYIAEYTQFFVLEPRLARFRPNGLFTAPPGFPPPVFAVIVVSAMHGEVCPAKSPGVG